MSVLKVASLTPLANVIEVELQAQAGSGWQTCTVSAVQFNGDVVLDGEFNLYELASAIVAFMETTTKPEG